MRKEITEEQITELMQAIPRAEEVDRLRAQIERLREDLALEKSGFVLQRGQVKKLRAKIDELMRSHEMCANAMRAESDRADEAWAEVEKQRAENEKLRAEIEALHEALRRGAKEFFVVERRTTGPDTPVAFIMEAKP